MARCAATASIFLMLVPRVASAQEGRVLTPVELFDPERGEGIRISPGFVLQPRMEAEITYDTNVYNVSAPERDDAVVSLRPAFLLRSDFSRHEFELRGSADIRRYFEISDENSEQYNLSAAARLDLAHGIEIVPEAGYLRGIEQRGTAGDVFFTDEPVAFHAKRASLSIARTGKRLELRAGGSIVQRDYSNSRLGGVPIDLSGRDVTVRRFNGRADFRINDRTKLFAEAGANEVDYRQFSDPSRDSKGFYVLGGVHLNVTSLVDIEAGVGYINQDFENPAVRSASGLNYRLSASWTPTPKWRVTARASRDIDPSRTSDSPVIIRSDFRLGAERAITDRILVGAEGGYTEEEYRGTPGADKRYFVSGTSRYRLTDNIGLFVSAGYRNQSGGSTGRNYKGFAARFGVRAEW